MVGGVCNGLAAYFHIDVTIVRAVCLLAALLTKGFAIMAYIALMFIIPEAKTPEARAAAGGTPLNAKDVIERAKKQYAEGHKHWRRHWRQQRRHWQRYGWSTGMRYAYRSTILGCSTRARLALAHLALFLTMAAMLISLVNTGAILQWRLPEDVPLWAGALILLVGYQIAVSPLRAVHFWTATPGAQRDGGSLRLLERGNLARRNGLRPVARVEPHPGNSRVPPERARAVSRLHPGHQRPRRPCSSGHRRTRRRTSWSSSFSDRHRTRFRAS